MHSTFMISYYLRYYKIVTLYKKKQKKITPHVYCKRKGKGC